MLLEIFFPHQNFFILFPNFMVSHLPVSKKADVILKNDFKMNMKLQGDWVLKPGDGKLFSRHFQNLPFHFHKEL